jgi:hypothetical protein
MEGIDEAKLKDAILAFLVKHGRYEQNALFEALNKPFGSLDAFDEFTLDMFRHHNKYFQSERVVSMVSEREGIFYNVTSKAKDFLNNGGFVASYQDKIVTLKRKKDVENAADRKTLLDSKFWFLPYIISVLSLFVAIWALLKQSPDTVNYDRQFKVLDVRLNQMKNALIKENDSLKNKLQEIDTLN